MQRSLLPRQHSFPWSSILLSLVYQYVQNRIISGHLSLSLPLSVSSISKAIQRYLFCSSFVGTVVFIALTTSFFMIVNFCCWWCINMFEIGLSLVLCLCLHLLLYHHVQQQYKGIYFVHCWCSSLYRLSNWYPFPWSEVDFCCCWYRYRYLGNRVITGPLSPSPPPPVSSGSTVTQRSLFCSLFVDAVVSVASTTSFPWSVLLLPGTSSGTGIDQFITVSVLESFLLMNKFVRDSNFFIYFIVGWCVGLYCFSNIVFHGSKSSYDVVFVVIFFFVVKNTTT